MAWSISDLFPPWGDAGERPSDNFQYDGGDQVNEKHLDYLWSQCAALEDEVRSALSDIDADGDGIVDRADVADEGTAPFTVRGDVQDSQATPLTIWDDTNKYVPTTQVQADTDGDGLIEDYDEAEIKDGGTKEIDAAEFAGGLGTAGQFLTTDGAAASWGSAPVEASETNDGSDLTEYRINGGAGTLLSVTGSGTFLGAVCHSQEGTGGQGQMTADITVDGGTTYTITDAGGFSDGSGYEITYMYIPPIRFSSSLDIVINRAESSLDIAVHAVLKQ